MQANEELPLAEKMTAQYIWADAAEAAAEEAELLVAQGAHKQIVNRLLEPFTYIDVLVTATDFANWFALRDHPDAQPEIQDLAKKMRAAYHTSIPKVLQPGKWHLPYISEDDWILAYDYCKDGRITRDEPSYREKLAVLQKVSTARCARVSYKAFDGKVASIDEDLVLFGRLLGSSPMHASPAEHQATPDTMISVERECLLDDQGDTEHLGVVDEWKNPHLHGNFRGWNQFRKMLPGEFIPG